MVRWTGLAPWDFEFSFPGSLTSTFLQILEGLLRDAGAERIDRENPGSLEDVRAGGSGGGWGGSVFVGDSVTDLAAMLRCVPLTTSLLHLIYE